ncbi:MAG: hypothetical protein IJ120_09270 [Solobacterium sp.]|nr:hypothetical protein [Solobacterium sp.]
MEELKELFDIHFEKYPMMRPEDCIKLLYQEEFGPSHAVRNRDEALKSILQEVAVSREGDSELFTAAGRWFVRIDLHKALEVYTPEDVADWFVRSAGSWNGSMAEYLKKLKWFDANLDLFPTSFTADEWKEQLSYHRGEAYSNVHHSKLYNSLYHPHYRLIRKGIWEF